jgi:colicin import membrane protein
MKKTLKLTSLVLSLLISVSTLAQTQAPVEKMSVSDRMAKARAAKAEKQAAKATMQTGSNEAKATNGVTKTTDDKTASRRVQSNKTTAKTSTKDEKATSADLKSPIDKSQKGPNGEVIYTGARGAKYYINKNGNKTYLSSNQ